MVGRSERARSRRAAGGVARGWVVRVGRGAARLLALVVVLGLAVLFASPPVWAQPAPGASECAGTSNWTEPIPGMEIPWTAAHELSIQNNVGASAVLSPFAAVSSGTVLEVTNFTVVWRGGTAPTAAWLEIVNGGSSHYLEIVPSLTLNVSIRMANGGGPVFLGAGDELQLWSNGGDATTDWILSYSGRLWEDSGAVSGISAAMEWECESGLEGAPEELLGVTASDAAVVLGMAAFVLGLGVGRTVFK